ncbi:hypothetical protein ACIQCQ_10090 [Streptomyces sp. NPDC088394]|uniref:hypothetical protein n=1 Tax=Streptomyces sp. NPDC088394 TaxID=3365860 RepID=UPI0038039B82
MLVESGAEAAAAVLGQDAGDDRGGCAVFTGGRAHGGAADQDVAEVGDLHAVAAGAGTDVVEGKYVTGDDQVVDVLPIVDGGVVVHRSDA